jgi:hypothetical protein
MACFCVIYQITFLEKVKYVNGTFMRCILRNRCQTRVCLAIKRGFISTDKPTLPIKGIGIHKILCLSTKCHYMTFRLVCGVLQLQLSLLDPSFSGTINSLRYVCTHSDTNFKCLFDYEKSHAFFFQQCSAKAPTTNNSVRWVLLMK